MKYQLPLVLGVFLTSHSILSQGPTTSGIAINESNSLPHQKAILDISSPDKGILIPRMTESQRLNINQPATGLMVYQVDGIPGFYIHSSQGWAAINKRNSSVPIGTIIDWWRPDGSYPIPEGYAICDGSMINDQMSPLNGNTLPDMTHLFVKGTNNLQMAGQYGGSLNHDHNLEGNFNTSSDSHNHKVNYPEFMSLFIDYVENDRNDRRIYLESVSFDHNHKWSAINSSKVWSSFNATGQAVQMIDWGDGVGAEGAGHYPFIMADGSYTSNYTDTHTGSHQHYFTTYYTHYSGGHGHSLEVGEKSTYYDQGGHNHSIQINETVSEASNVLQNTGLLKLMRIH